MNNTPFKLMKNGRLQKPKQQRVADWLPSAALVGTKIVPSVAMPELKSVQIPAPIDVAQLDAVAVHTS
jgi:hypothetical protein